MMKKSNLSVKIIPAPLAGWTDYAMRAVLVDCGAREVWTEMINATALVRDNAKTVAMLKPVTTTGVRQVVQLFGREPADFVTVINSGLLKDYDEVNLNMGCPAPKIIKNHCGCALMKDLDAARRLIALCRDATKQTGQALSVKMRLGWDKDIAVEFAQMCEKAGVDRLIVHGRLGIDGYRGTADYAGIARVKAAVKISVIANGDIRDRASYEKCLAETHADGVMVGRALCGAPWKINLDDQVPTYARIVELMQMQKRLHIGNPSDLIKHWLAYQKQLKKLYPDQPVPVL
ncbi:MAG: tRNA-dihydrouridine synthase family protein [Clostridia bacterium]|nr:tRNA-dihydrouridine synthase family protein [Clostridia bacterium]